MAKVLVFVHGAGKYMSNYAEPMVAEIALLSGAEPLCVPVYFADICNVGSPVGAMAFDVDTEFPPLPCSAPEPPEMTDFKLRFEAEVQKNQNSLSACEDTFSTRSFEVPFIVEDVATEVNEIARYLYEPTTYNKIQARMCEGLEQAAQLGGEIVIASHSLGTLVAFDALRAAGGLYNISTFFTLGCPLGLLRRLGQRTMDLGQIQVDRVREWQNWYCSADPISSAIGPWFPQQGYRLRDVFVSVASKMPEAHDYLNNKEVLGALARAVW